MALVVDIRINENIIYTIFAENQMPEEEYGVRLQKYKIGFLFGDKKFYVDTMTHFFEDGALKLSKNLLDYFCRWTKEDFERYMRK